MLIHSASFFQALTACAALCDWLLAAAEVSVMAHAPASIGIGITLLSLCRFL